MGIERAIDITSSQRKTILALIQQYLPGVAVWAYGSRVKWTSRPQSDLDLVTFASPEQKDRVGDLREAFEESDLPFKVDLFVWDEVPESFREKIEAECVILKVQNDRKQPPSPNVYPVRLTDVAELIMGQSPPSSTYNNTRDGLPFFQGVKDFNYRYPSPRVFCSNPSRVAQPGDILLSVRAPIGRVNIANRKCAVGRGLAAIKPRDKADIRYLEFLLRHAESGWGGIEGGGSVFGCATRKDIEELPLLWHRNRKERHAIAHVLGSLDDKIDLNRRMNETLEEMARALFKSWFVDFDPVRAKMENRNTGLPKHIADLFPDRLVESELGEIPEGWKIHSLGEVVETVKGCSYRRSELAESDTALVTLKSFARGGGYRPDGLKEFVGEYKPDQVVRPGEIVISCTDVTQAAEVVGRPAIIPATSACRTLVASLDVLIVRPSQKSVTRAFLYFLTGNARFAAHAYAYTTGTTVLHLAKEAVPSFRFACSTRVANAFDNFARPLLGRIQQIRPESELMATFREALLPKLVSGKLRVNKQLLRKMEGRSLGRL